MKKNPDIRTITIGIRTLDIIEGLTIKKYIPEAILPNVNMALADQEMTWTDDVITGCTMVISQGVYISMMYKHEPKRFNGLLLFTYCQGPKNGHCFGFPKKGNHIGYYINMK